MQDYPVPDPREAPCDVAGWLAARICTKCGYVSEPRRVPGAGPFGMTRQLEPDPLPVVTVIGAPRPEDDGAVPVCAACLQLTLALLRNPRAIVTIGLEPTAAHGS